MVPTNRQAPGLLSFFGVKNGGSNPQYGMDQFLAVMDLQRWLLSDPLAVEFATSQGAAAAIGAVAFGATPLTVPAGQLWIVTDFSAITGSLGAGVTLEATPVVQIPVLGTGMDFAVGPNFVAPTPKAFFSGTSPGVPLFLAAGFSLGLLTTNLVGAAPNVVLSARFSRLTF